MKRSIKIALSVLSLFVWTCEGLSQQPAKDLTSQFEKGDISEIQHKRRVFVVADRPIQADNMIKALKKYQGIQVVSSATDVEYVIAYTVERKKYRVSISVQGAPPPIDWEFFGRMLVYLPQKSGKHRLVWDTLQRYRLPQRGERIYWPYWEQPLEESMINRFIKALKTSRGEK